MGERLEYLDVTTGLNAQEFKRISGIKDHSWIQNVTLCTCDLIDMPDLKFKWFYICCMCMRHLFFNEQEKIDHQVQQLKY